MGLFGLLVILVLETVATVLLLDRSPVEAFYAATQAIVTVGPDQAVDHGPAWFKIFSAASMLAGVAFTRASPSACSIAG